MRILNIYFKNINSLEGEGRVAFDQGPIAESGIFAITGPNGSGKTSILDVITLGLYGETYRFDKPAAHIITEHTEDSFAQVEFEFNTQKYRASWQVNRANLQQPQMSLSHLGAEDTLLADSPAQVRNYLFELTGMDFHKFSKAIVLPQGAFASFLNALDSERLDILEKISGSDFFNHYQQQISAQQQAIQVKITALQQEAVILPLIDDATLEAAEHDLQDFKDLRDELKSEQLELQTQLRKFHNVQALQTQLQQVSQKHSQLETLIAQQERDFRRIDQAPQLEALQEELSTLDSLQAELNQNQQKLIAYQTDLGQLQQQIALAGDSLQQQDLQGKNWQEQKSLMDGYKIKISEIKLELPREIELAPLINQQLQEKQQAQTELQSWLQAHQADALLLETFPDVVPLRNLRTEIAELSGLQKNTSSWSKKLTSSVEKNKTALLNTQTRLDELKALIDNRENSLTQISRGKSVVELKELLADQQNRVNDFQELVSIANISARFSEKKPLFSWFNKQSEKPLADVDELQAQFDQLQRELATEENIAKALDQAIANEMLLKRLNSPRNRLQEGKPCFLCGSTHHPYSVKPPQVTDFKQALTDQRTKVQILKLGIEKIEGQLTSTQKRVSNNKAKQQFLAEKHEAWLLLANKLTILRDGLDITQLATQKQLLATETAELEKIKTLLKDYTQYQRDIGLAKEEIVAKQALAANLRITAEQLDSSWSERAPEVDELLGKYQQLQTEEANLLKRLEPQLKLLGEKLPAKGKEDAVFDRLNSRRQEYQINQLRLQGIVDEIKDLQTKLQTCQTTINRYQQQLHENLEALRQEEGLGLLLAKIDKQQQVETLEQQLKEQNLVFASLQRSFAEKIATQGFENIAAFTQLRSLVNNVASLQSQYRQNKELYDQLSLQQLRCNGLLKEELQDFDDSISEQDLLDLQRLLAEKIEIAEHEVRNLLNKLDKQQKYRRKHQSLEVELDEYRRQLALVAAESLSLQAEPAEVKAKVKELLITQLLNQANQILEKISGRYYLRSVPSEHGLALEIEDSKQGNVRRLPKTLSGGESFIVSLALSLALADIANNGKTIESLFLDEGFGNLDAEALYMAMSALEVLKFQGRTVGIISHVEAVKKRIKTQIELVKKANGLSELKLVA